MTTSTATGGSDPAARSHSTSTSAASAAELIPPATLSVRLREATADHHVRAEKHMVQQALVRGQATPGLYHTWLLAMRALHEVFEARLETARRLPGFGGLIEDHHFRVALIDEDLDAMAVIIRRAAAASSSSAIPTRTVLGPRTSAAWAAIDAMIEVDPAVVVGPFYVLEGSTNGGRFIAKAIRHSLPLPPNAGTRYLDPHGELIRERWARAKSAIDALPLTPAQHDAIIDAAQRTFDAVTDLMDEMPKT